MFVRRSYFLAVAICLYFSLCQCTAVQENEKYTTDQPVYIKEQEIKNKHALAHEGTRQVGFTNLLFDPKSFHNDTEGLKIVFEVSLTKGLIDSLLRLHYEGLYVNISCTTKTGNVQASKQYCDQKQRVFPNREQFISTPGVRQIEYHLPYRLLELPAGNHELNLEISILPVEFKGDTSVPGVKFIKRYSQQPVAWVQTTVKVKTPDLLKAVLDIHSFKINTQAVNPQKFDFSVGGSGLPDLYWTVSCGDLIIYRSPQEKNSINYTRRYRTPAFFCSKNDVVKLTIADADNGPFNTEDDVVEVWETKVQGLTFGKEMDITVGNIEHLMFQAINEK